MLFSLVPVGVSPGVSPAVLARVAVRLGASCVLSGLLRPALAWSGAASVLGSGVWFRRPAAAVAFVAFALSCGVSVSSSRSFCGGVAVRLAV